ncbi:hypothetical protein V6R21_07160 [Limibacter armeniacum]|uniref:hypothetical protein n=1 Tax=Limibacter armeniacum TaxID=466084 RepID=UPI002FE5D398
MKKLILLLSVTIISFSCSSENTSSTEGNEQAVVTETPDVNLAYEISARQIKRFKNRKFAEVPQPFSFQISENEDVYSLVKPKLKFYEVETMPLSEQLQGKILFAQFPKEVAVDGDLKLLFFATYNKEGKPVDLCRLAKYESVADIHNVEACKIVRNRIIKEVERNVVDEEGNASVEKINENFYINGNGKIEKI